ncbi:MAG: YggS family pyridoxal phosphate enzyme, partial [Cyanobacteria bacterium]|nr:YggS family pyridoxal phosphate enzyme [Cyanobacteriota bacterium]
MTMAPHTKEAGIIEKTFISLHELRDSLVHEFGNPLPELSMGMSGDYVHAIQCGATIIRIGSAFFAS